MAYGDMYDPNGNHLSDMTSQIKDDLTQTLRSVRDTLSTSFQTLNLTMSSIHSTLRTMSSAFVPQGGLSHSPNMIPSFGANINTGAMSGPMGQHLANSSMWGLATAAKPFNVGGYEWAWERQKEMNHRFTQFGVDATTAIPGLAAGSFASMAALKYAGRSAALGGAVRAGGMAGSIARGAVGGIPGMAVSLGVDAVTGLWGDAANEYGRDIAGVRRMSTRFGNEFTNKQSSVVAKGMTNYAHREMLNSTDFDTKLGTDGVRTVAMQGMQMNLFQGRKPEELVKQMESAASVVKFLTGVLGSKDVNETMRYVGQMKNMGINMAQSPQYAMKLGLAAHKYGGAMGVPGSELLGQATQIGAQAYSQYGMPSFGGIQPAMQSMALAHEMEKRKILSTAEVAAGGGHNNIAGQMVGFTAGMMNNSGIGKMMLAAGWQGGGKYSMGKMQGALNKGGGYFGAVDNALSGIAGDPDKYADFMMNLENLQASAAEQGGLDQQTEDMLFAALDQMGTFKNDNTAAMMLKKLAAQEGIPLSTAAAKTIVMKHRRPSTMKSIDREQQRGLNRGFHAQNALEYSPFRGLGRLGEAIDRIGPRIKHNLVTKPGQWLRDQWSGIVGEPDENMMGTGAGQFNQFTMDNYDPNMGGPSPNHLKSDDASFNQAFRYGSDSLMMGKNPTGEAGTPWWMKSSAANMMPSIEGMLARQHKDYYKAMLDPNAMGTHESISSVSDLLNGRSNDVLRRYRGSDAETNNGGEKYWNVLGGGTHFLADNMSKSSLDALSSATTNSSWYKELGDGEANNIISAAGIDRSQYSDSNAMMTRLLDDQNGELAKQAKSRGISSRNLAYGLVSSSYGKEGVDNLSNFNRLMGANDQQYSRIDKAGGSLSRSEGHTFGAEKWASQADNTMGLTGETGTATLKALGLTMDDIRDIVNSPGGRQQLDAFAEAASKVANGDELGRDFSGVTHPILKGALEKIADKDKKGFIDSISGDSNIGFKASGADFSEKIHNFMGGIGNVGSIDNAKTMLSDMGFDGADEAGVKKALSSGNMGKYAAGLRGTTKESKGLLEQLRSVDNMSMDDLHEQFGDMAKGSSLEEVRKNVQNSLTYTTKQAVDNKNQDKDVQKSLIDTAVDSNMKAVRTMEVDRGIRDAAEKVRGAGSTSVPNGNMTTTPNAAKSVLPNSGSATSSSSSTPIADWFKSRGW